MTTTTFNTNSNKFYSGNEAAFTQDVEAQLDLSETLATEGTANRKVQSKLGGIRRKILALGALSAVLFPTVAGTMGDYAAEKKTDDKIMCQYTGTKETPGDCRIAAYKQG